MSILPFSHLLGFIASMSYTLASPSIAAAAINPYI
jgi:hypothetical protein